MTRERKTALPPEQSAALIEELGAVGGIAGAAADVRPFVLGSEDFRPVAWLPGLERIGEKFARRLRPVIEPLVQSRTKIAAEPIETCQFERLRADLPDFMSLNFYRLRPLKNGLLVLLEPDFVSSVVDVYFGGTGAVQPRVGAEFTPTEDRVIARLTDGVVDALVDAWSEVLALSPALTSRDTNPAYANLFRPEEMVVVQRFTITTGQGTTGHGRQTTVSVLYALNSIRPLEGNLTVKVHDDAGPADAQSRRRMAEAMNNVRLPVRSVLARPEMTAARLMALKPGDIIPISVGAKVPLLVGNRHFATGTIGEKNGHASLQIESFEKGNFQ